MYLLHRLSSHHFHITIFVDIRLIHHLHTRGGGAFHYVINALLLTSLAVLRPTFRQIITASFQNLCKTRRKIYSCLCPFHNPPQKILSPTKSNRSFFHFRALALILAQAHKIQQWVLDSLNQLSAQQQPYRRHQPHLFRLMPPQTLPM
jgi:hypothetical protein